MEALPYVPGTCITLRREDVIMIGFIADYEVIKQPNNKKGRSQDVLSNAASWPGFRPSIVALAIVRAPSYDPSWRF